MRPKPIREGVETLTRLSQRCVAAALVLAAIGGVAAADATPFDARVIWSRGDRAYIVARDTVWVSAGSSLRFFEKKKEIASGVVMLVEDSMLVVARIMSGSLARVKHLDRIRVEAERGASAARTALRVGYPSSSRVQPFFECRRMVLGPQGYRADTLGERSYRLVRSVPKPPEPDTLQVRLFDDAADEEIALERGELDAAVFWPGEASTHIRQAMNWDGRSSACRYRGVVVTRMMSPPDLPSDDDNSDFYGLPRRVDRGLLDSLNTELFHGDLQAPLGWAGGGGNESPALFRVDPSCPAHDAIEKFLNRGASTRATWSYSLMYLDVPTDTALADRSLRWAFLIACPVIGQPELRPYLQSIDLSAIVNLFDCVTPARKP
jgi:hypothetical protein